MPNDPHVVFISYAWGGESESVANEIDQAVGSAGITLIRDKRDLGFKGLIKEFMEKIGQGHAVILVISDKYLKSPNCMFELLEVQKSGDFHERIFPLVLPDAAIYKSTGIISYLKYWEGQIDELNEAIKGLDSFADTQGIRDDIDLFTDIRGAIAKLASTFRNMNTLTIAEMRSKSFAPLLELLGQKVSTGNNATSKPNSKYGKVLYHIPELMQIQEWTRCIVRLAWDELLLTQNLRIPEEEKIIDDIRLGEVMQVCIEEGRDENAFEIKSLSSTEQVILSDDYTEWLFDVKAKREGTFTLVLRVTLLQIVEGFGERKKDIVLERNVTTKALAPEPLPVFEASSIAVAKPSKEKPLAEFQNGKDADEMIGAGISPKERYMPKPTVLAAPMPKALPPNQSKATWRKIIPYAASISLLIAVAVFVFPEFSDDLEKESSGETAEFPNTSSPPEAMEQEEPRSTVVPPAKQITNKVLVTFNLPNTSTPIDVENSLYAFVIPIESIDSLKTDSLQVNIYELDLVRIPDNLSTKPVSARKILDSINTSRAFKLKQPAQENSLMEVNN